MVLSNRFPSDRPTGPADKEARKGAIFEEFERRTILDSAAKLATPAGIAEGSELVALRRGRWCRIGVCLFVVVIGEVIKCLESVRRVRMERDAIL